MTIKQGFDFSNFTDECVKCGKCIPVCTIYQNSPDEITSPRGFNHLLSQYHKGNFKLDRQAKKIFETCFLCTNCVDVCPVDVPTDMVIEQVRRDIAEKFGIAWFKRIFFLLLRYRILFDIFSKLGFAFKTCFFKEMRDDALLPRFYLPIIKSQRLLPALAKKSFLNSYADHNDFTQGKPSCKVAVFIGCLANYNYTSTGHALMQILERLEVKVMIPKQQMCCSAPAYFTGDFKTVDFLVKKNIAYFEKFIDEVEAILVPEATCSSIMVHDWVRYLHDQPSWKARAAKIIKKIKMASVWLDAQSKLQDLLKKAKKQNLSFTYHDPCHAKKTQGVYDQPRNLLQNYELKPMSNPDRCCGFGGVTMQTENYELARKAGIPKAKMIRETKADFVSAECSACHMQITNALYQDKNKTQQFKHPLELIAKSLATV